MAVDDSGRLNSTDGPFASGDLSGTGVEDVRYTCTLLRAGRILLDAGSMFGLIPRVVWSKAVQPDEHDRIELSHNCLLLREIDAPSTRRPRIIVIETGSGDKLPEKMQGIFGFDGRTVETALAEQGVKPEDVTDVIVSHLHFDHAGGLTRLCRPGETPDWHGPDGGGGSEARGGVKLTFPNATVHVQRREWEDALANRSVMTRTYYRDHLDPLADRKPGRGGLSLTESLIPFPKGHVPDRDEAPQTAIHNRLSEVLPGVSVFLTPGHTWGQQAVLFTDERGRRIVFTPDVLPTRWHVGAAYSLGYDVEPYTSMITRRWLLTDAAEHGWVLCLDHEPGEPFFRVRGNGKGWFELIPEH